MVIASGFGDLYIFCMASLSAIFVAQYHFTTFDLLQCCQLSVRDTKLKQVRLVQNTPTKIRDKWLLVG